MPERGFLFSLCGDTALVDSLQDLPPFRGHSPDQERALGGYAALMGVFGALCAGFAAFVRVTGRPLSDRPGAGDVVLVTLATHKASRLIAKDRVTSVIRAPFTEFEEDAGPSEVDEAARGRGLRRAIGELLICPYCLGLWTAAIFTAGLIIAPRATRWIATPLVVVFGADLLQIAYKKAEDSL